MGRPTNVIARRLILAGAVFIGAGTTVVLR